MCNGTTRGAPVASIIVMAVSRHCGLLGVSHVSCFYVHPNGYLHTSINLSLEKTEEMGELREGPKISPTWGSKGNARQDPRI